MIYIPFLQQQGCVPYGTLKLWLQRWAELADDTPVALLTDTATMNAIATDIHIKDDKPVMPPQLCGIPLVVCRPENYEQVIRPGNVLDRRSALILDALATIGPALIVDLEVVPTREICEIVAPLIAMRDPIAMRCSRHAADIKWFTPGGLDIMVPHNDATVLAFVYPLPSFRDAIIADYIKAWTWATAGNIPGFTASAAWSLTNYWAEGAVLNYNDFTYLESNL